MKTPLTKFVLPIDKKVFRLHIMKCLCFQILLATIAYIVLQNREATMKWFDSWDDYYVAWWFNLFMLVFVYDINKYRARFKDIYPDMELNRIFYFFIGFIPLFFFMMTIFLCVKESDSGTSYPRAFRKRYALLAVIPLFALQGQFSRVGFWTSPATSYYTVDLIHQQHLPFTFRINKNSKNIFADYESETGRKPGAMETAILLGKLSGQEVIPDRGLASENLVEATYANGIIFSRACAQALILSEDNIIKITDYSPLQWLHPSGPVDLFVAKSLDYSLREKMSWQLANRCKDLIEKLEGMNFESEKYSLTVDKELAAIRGELLKSRIFSESLAKSWK